VIEGHWHTTSIERLQRGALVAGCVGAAVCGVEACFRPARFFPAYLSGWLLWWGVSCGSLAIAMIHHLTGGAWGAAIRRPLEAAAAQMSLMAILFAPIWLGLRTLYAWADAEHSSAESMSPLKGWYLSETGFLWRAVAYFVFWSVLALVLNGLSAAGNADRRGRSRALGLISGPGLVLWGLAVTFAAIDWVMSLEPHWSSTTFGVLVAAGQGVGALSVAIALLIIASGAEPSTPMADVLNDLGNFLLAFVMFWAYISFTQFLIIWSGNLPEETPWYLRRASGGWQFVAMALAAFHFAVPFLLLLVRNTKRQPRRLLAVTLLLLIMRLVDWQWLVMPTFVSSPLDIAWTTIAAPIGIGGFWVAGCLWRLSARGALAGIGLGKEATA